MLNNKNINFLLDIILEAGKILLNSKVHSANFKIDSSPVTNVDNEINSFLKAKLSYFNLPIISEESDFDKYPNEDFWLIDPLDGTKNFIIGDGQCTINIALMKNMAPIFGMVYAPFYDELYYGPTPSKKVFCVNRGIQTMLLPSSRRQLNKHVSSKLHVENFTLPSAIELFKLGSSLKYVRVAKAEYDFSIRTEGSSEWDIAACHPILKALGGNFFDINTKSEILYNKKKFRNGPFLCFRSPFTFDTFEHLVEDIIFN